MSNVRRLVLALVIAVSAALVPLAASAHVDYEDHHCVRVTRTQIVCETPATP